MKKIFIALLFVFISKSFFAQTCGGTPILFEDFESGIPSSWIVLNYDTNSLFFNMPLKGYTGAWQPYNHYGRKCAANASRYSGSGSDGQMSNDFLITPSLNLGTGPICISWKASTVYSGYAENYEIRISTTTPDSTGMFAHPSLAVFNSDVPDWTEHNVDLSAYAGQTVYVGFWYNANDQYAIFIDDIQISHPTNADASVTSLDIKNIILPSSQIISGSLLNAGLNAITSMNLNWNVNNGSVNTMSLSSLNIPPSSYFNYTHTANWNAATNGTYTLKVWASNINGGADMYTGNDTLTQLVFVNNFPRKVLMEEFTQASCPPCASQNPAFDATLYNSRVLNEISSVQYHTVWPGVDPMNAFNKTGADARVEYYGVAGVPSAIIDGEFVPDSCSYYVGAPLCLTQTMIDRAHAVPSIFDIQISSIKSGNNIDVQIRVTAKTDIPLTALKLYAIIVEDTVTYTSPPGTNGESEFYQVMRTILPDSSGQSLSTMFNNQITTFNYSYPIDPTYVETELKTVAFIQDDVNKKVLQSEMTQTTYTGIKTFNAKYEAGAFPNPAKGIITLTAKNIPAETVSWKIYNVLSEQIFSGREETAGKNFRKQIDLSSLQSGIYFAELVFGNEKETIKIVKQ